MRWLFSNPAGVDHKKIVAAIARAETKTSGKIQVLVARHRARDPVKAAQRHFAHMGLAGTPQHNAVLLFVAPRSRNFAVIGDAGVHARCGDEFWRDMAKAMEDYFKRGDFTGGLVHGIERAGELLAAHFPREGT